MDLQVEKEIDQYTKEVWCFTMFNYTPVFTEWRKEEKPKGKRTWKTVKRWSKYLRTDFFTVPEPELTDDVRAAAKDKLVALIHVLTWKEHKGL